MTFDEILQAYLADLKELIPDLDTSDGSEVVIRAKAFAARLDALYYRIDQAKKATSILTAVGEDLDDHVEQRKLSPRKSATEALGTVRFSRSVPDIVDRVIPLGTEVGTKEGPDGSIISFLTTQQAVLTAGQLQIDVPVEAKEPGSRGNVAGGSIVQFVGKAPAGIESVTNIDPTAGGTDEEDDETLRARSLEAINNQDNGGTPDDYKRWAQEIPGVTTAICLPVNRGNGTTDVVIASNGTPPDSLVAEVQAHIDGKKPIGADALVLKATAVSVGITATVTPSDGFTITGLTESIHAAIDSYLKKIPIGGVVRKAGIQNAIYDVVGVIDCEVSAPSSNVQLAAVEFPIRGVVTLS